MAVPDRRATVDGCIGNVGITQPFVRVVDLDTNAIERLLETNLIGTIRVTTAF